MQGKGEDTTGCAAHRTYFRGCEECDRVVAAASPGPDLPIADHDYSETCNACQHGHHIGRDRASREREDPPERFDRSWWHYADDCPVAPSPGPDLQEALDLDETLRRAIYSVWPGLGQSDTRRLVTALRAALSATPRTEVSDEWECCNNRSCHHYIWRQTEAK